ncbi:hypothetical protein J4411_01705 [Candidatus Pacearchaeota archaeon]|nr:hypothetical protein [Candidatus Pacearchaeota archaeon]
MEIKLVEEKKNPLFSRREIVFQVKSNVVPSHEEIKNLLKEKFSFNPHLVRTKKIEGKFGAKIFDVLVNVYDSKEEFKRIVRKTKQELEKEKKEVDEEMNAKAEAKKAKEVGQPEEKKEEVKE